MTEPDARDGQWERDAEQAERAEARRAVREQALREQDLASESPLDKMRRVFPSTGTPA